MAQEQRAQQRGDVRAVGVGIGEDADLAVAQVGRLSEPGSTPSATEMSCTSCDARTSVRGSTSQVFRILPRSGMIAWNSRSRACLAEPPAESPSTRNSSVRSGVLAGAVGQLARQRRPGGRLLAHDLLRRLQPASARFDDRHLRDLVAGFRMLVEPQAERILDDAGHERRGLARRQAFLGLPGELRVLQLDRQHEADPSQTSSGAILTPRGSRLRKLAEFAHRVGQAGAQAVDVGAALRRSGSG